MFKIGALAEQAVMSLSDSHETGKTKKLCGSATTSSSECGLWSLPSPKQGVMYRARWLLSRTSVPTEGVN